VLEILLLAHKSVVELVVKFIVQYLA
jgi:hypothetical protein